MGRGQGQQGSGVGAATLRQGAADLRALKREGLESACAEILQANPQVASIYVELPLSGEVSIYGIREGHSLLEGFSTSTGERLDDTDFVEVTHNPDTSLYTHWNVFRGELLTGGDKLSEIFGEISWADVRSWATEEDDSEDESIVIEVPRGAQPKITYNNGKSWSW